MIETVVQARAWLAEHQLWAGLCTYDDGVKAWLAKSGHYLDNPPPGALFAIAVRPMIHGLFGLVPSDTKLVGLGIVGRPIARKRKQDGSWGELTRFVLVPGLPKGTASRVLRVVIHTFFERPGATDLISFHDRTRHTGCIYKKAGFKKDGAVTSPANGWASRPGREKSAAAAAPKKRRWRITRDEYAG